MRGFNLICCAIAIFGLPCAVAAQPQNGAPLSAPSQTATGQDGCESYIALQPIEPTAVKLLATPLVPANRTVFTDDSIKRLQDWDLPSKVIAWHDRPSAEDLARQWDEMNKQWSAGSQNKDKEKSKASVPLGRAAPYSASSLPAREWQDLEKWLGRNGPKKVPGLCMDSGKATYILAVGIISGGAGFGPGDNNYVGQYAGYASKPVPTGLGPNSGTAAPYKAPHDEFAHAGMANGAGGNTCVYLYRTNGKAIGTGGTRQETPEYFYCHGGGGISQSTVTTMLKFLSKTGVR